MSRVYAKFPRTGLGNKMLVWARAIVFARENKLPCTTSLWWGLRLGPILRKEQQKRLYWGYFIETPVWKIMAVKFYRLLAKIESNPPLSETGSATRNTITLFLFDKVNLNDDLFGYIRHHHELIRAELWNMLHPRMKSVLAKYENPFIGVHIRRGDFKYGMPITPLPFFIKAICLVRQTVGKQWPVTVFTDATRSEIKEVLDLPGVFLAEDKPDIIDIFLMSRSKVLVLSKGSTFSYWGAFLSEGVIIKAHDWQEQIKGSDPDGNYREVKWDHEDSATDIKLLDALQKLK